MVTPIINKTGFCLICFLLFCTSPLMAQSVNVPVPERKELTLETIEQALERKKQEQIELNAEIKREEKSLKRLQSDMKNLTRTVQKLEQSLFELGEEQAALRKEETALKQKLESSAQKNTKLISALIKARQMPPEVMIFSKENAQKIGIIQAGLTSALPVITNEIRDLQSDLKRLNEIESSLLRKKSRIKSEKQSLSEEQDRLKLLIVKRQNMFESHRGLLSLQSAQIERIAARAADLKELLSRLQAQKPKIPSHLRNASRPERKITMPARGNKRLPVAGVIKVGFGKTDDIGAVSEGLRIRTPAQATVVAPMGGVVRYQGSFKQYQNLIIIEHDGSYHSVIAGLASTNVVLQQSVVAGEPIGRMGLSGEQDELYYELRHRGKPVSPI